MYHLREHGGRFPCLHCQPRSYIRMVQHLIERCLLLRLNRDDTVDALARHASIRPLITLAVWRELLKENRGFFHAYFQEMSQPKPPPYELSFPRTPRRRRRRRTWR